jgi:hypothetical protein
LWEGRVGVGSVVVACEEVEEVFEATRLDHADKLDERVKQLESVGCVMRNGTVVTRCQDPS